jgi:membrane-bound serine protease (ClpP class)
VALVAGFVALAIFGPPWGIVAIAAGALIEIGELYLWVRYLRRFRVRTGAEGLIGERGEVLAECRPTGSVRVHGEIWKAECEAGAAVGEAVVVKAVRGLRLAVEPAAPESWAR